jgi:hypothetical protein
MGHSAVQPGWVSCRNALLGSRNWVFVPVAVVSGVCGSGSTAVERMSAASGAAGNSILDYLPYLILNNVIRIVVKDRRPHMDTCPPGLPAGRHLRTASHEPIRDL